MIEMSPPIAIMIDSIIHGSIKNLLRCNKHKLSNVLRTHLQNEVQIQHKVLMTLLSTG